MRTTIGSFIIFFTIFLSLYGGVHLYVFLRIIDPLKLPLLLHTSLRILFLFFFLSFPFIHFIARGESNSLIRVINYISSVWMGALLYLFLLTIIPDLVIIITRILGVHISIRPAARILFTTIIALLITIYGLWEANTIGITKLKVKMPNLPAKLEGFKIAQISDVHMGLIINGTFLDKIITMTNSLHPDIIVITGDLLDAQAFHIEEIAAPLKRLKSRYGVLGVTGNHEYIAGIHKSIPFVNEAGIQLLRNNWITVAEDLQFVGRDDPSARFFTGKRPPALEEITKGIDRTKPIILLYHTPDTRLGQLEKLGIQLQLSGHTHRGQLWPFNYIVKLFYQTCYGLYQSEKAAIYVSRGTGTWGPPMRVLAPPEITLITLSRKVERSEILK